MELPGFRAGKSAPCQQPEATGEATGAAVLSEESRDPRVDIGPLISRFTAALADRTSCDHGRGIERRNGSNSQVLTPLSWPESNTPSAREWLAWDEPRAVEDPMHVETSFARNLGGLIRSRQGIPDRLMQAKAEYSAIA